jgi:hypothetical protein
MDKRQSTAQGAPMGEAFASLQHEAGDRTHVIAGTFSDYVQSHRFIQQQPELAAQADAIGEALGRLYQAIWQATDEKTGEAE